MSNTNQKTHYRKAFNSPYLSSADIVGPTILTISRVVLELDHSKRTKDKFNTAYFVEKEIRRGEILKPMILNACNSNTMKLLSGSPYIDDWCNIPVTIYVDNKVRFGRETVEGLRISPQPPAIKKPVITPDNSKLWNGAIQAYKRDGNFLAVEEKADIAEERKNQIVELVKNEKI